MGFTRPLRKCGPGENQRARDGPHYATFVLLHLALPGRDARPIGVALVDGADVLYCRTEVPEDAEDAAEILRLLPAELIEWARIRGGTAVVAYMEEAFSNTIRVGDAEYIWIKNPIEAVEDIFLDRVRNAHKVSREVFPSTKVLVVEDDPWDAYLIRRALCQYSPNIFVTITDDGHKALDILEQVTDSTKPDLVLLDLNLPKLGGHEVLARLRANPCLAELPVAVLSSSCAPADMEQAYAEGANTYVQKAIDLEGFTASVLDLCSRFLTAAA